MITIDRRLARRLRVAFRRHVLGIAHKGPIPPLVLHAEARQLRAQYRYAELAVEYVEPGGPRPLDSVPVPLEALAEVEVRDDSPERLRRWQALGLVPGATVAFLRHQPLDDLFEIQVGDRVVPLGSEGLAGLLGELVGPRPGGAAAGSRGDEVGG